MTTFTEINEALQWRYATKKFDPAKSVSQENLDAILEAIRLAPTSFGLQPFHVYVVADADKKAKIYPADGGNGPKVDAPYSLIFSIDTDIASRIEKYAANMAENKAPEEAITRLKGYMQGFTGMMVENGSIEAWCARQMYIALGFALETAAELRVDSCAIELFDFEAARAVLAMPANHKPIVALALGYRATDDNVFPKYRLPKEVLITK